MGFEPEQIETARVQSKDEIKDFHKALGYLKI
jgi:hypothetical protein